MNVKDMTGNIRAVRALPSTSIATVRAILCHKLGNPDFGKGGYRLMYGDSTLSDYDILDGCTLHEGLTFGAVSKLKCLESCGDFNTPSGLPPCCYWCPNMIHMDPNPPEEILAMNGLSSGEES